MHYTFPSEQQAKGLDLNSTRGLLPRIGGKVLDGSGIKQFQCIGAVKSGVESPLSHS